MLTKRKKHKKGANTFTQKPTGYHDIECQSCGLEVAIVAADIVKYTCGTCVQKVCAPPENYNKKKDNEGFPRGWHFKKRFEGPDGKIYSFGKLAEDESTSVDTVSKNVNVEPPVKKKRGRPRKDKS